MNHQSKTETTTVETRKSVNPKNKQRLKLIGAALTLVGIGLFVYFIYSVGFGLILHGIGRIGFGGFALIMSLYFLRLVCRAHAWKMCVSAPHDLNFKDALSAVIIGEALSSLLPLGILISGTSKAVAVRNRVPFVIGLSSVATENLFYSLVTGLFIVGGACAFLRSFTLEAGWFWLINLLIAAIIALTIFAFVLIIRRWHFLSSVGEWIYERGFFKRILENGRGQIRLFENLIFDFYRRYPRRFLPILTLEAMFHLLGVLEVWFILSRLSADVTSLFASFLLESMSRVITVIFKLVPLLIGVDEAGARFVAQTLALGAGIGVTLAIIRKGRILFWTAIGLILIAKRGLSIKELAKTLE